MKIYAGTSGYGYREWKGKFYPGKISPREMLRFYSERFKTVEINNTFYHMPKEDILASWSGQVPEDFIFSVKAPQVITHLKQLRNTAEETSFFLRSLSVLQKKQGPVLFQLPKSFRADLPVLKDFLDLIPDGLLCAFEFRSPSWMNDKIFEVLSRKGCSLCLADTEENPVNQVISTAPWGYMRLRRSGYTDEDLSQWREKIVTQKWNTAFVYFKHEEEAKGPQMAMRFLELGQPNTNKKSA